MCYGLSHHGEGMTDDHDLIIIIMLVSRKVLIISSDSQADSATLYKPQARREDLRPVQPWTWMAFVQGCESAMALISFSAFGKENMQGKEDKGKVGDIMRAQI